MNLRIALATMAGRRDAPFCPVPAKSVMQATLVVVSGKTDKRRLSITLPIILGRSHQADLTIAHSLISRKHCALLNREGVVILRDLGSLNGTFVRGEKVTGDVRLLPNDEFSIGPVTFQIQYGSPQARASAPTASGLPGTVVAGQAPPEAADDSSGTSSSRVRLVDRGRFPLPCSPSSSPAGAPAGSPIELNETLPGSAPKPALGKPEPAVSERETVPFSIAPEDGQLPDFSQWCLAEDVAGAEPRNEPAEAPPIQVSPPLPGGPPSEPKAMPGKAPKRPATDDSD